MMDAADAARRRELQRRAYAPGGRLTDAEAAELRALDERALDERDRSERDRMPIDAPPTREDVVPPAEADAAPAAGAPAQHPTPQHPTHTPGADTPDVGRDPGNGPTSGVSAPDAVPASEDPARVRRPWMRVTLVGVLAVLLGLGAGWLVFGREAAPVMSAAQSEVFAKLQDSGDYDPGSIALLGDKYDVSVWGATKDGSTSRCLVLTHAKQTTASCVDAKTYEESNPENPLQVNMQYREDETDFMLWAGYTQGIDGRRVVVMQRFDQNTQWDWRSQYTTEELAVVDKLVEQGFDGEFLQIVGYDGPVPVWLYQGDRTCVIAQQDDTFAQACGELVYDSGMSLDLAVPGVTYSVLAPANRNPLLTILRTSPSITCDVDTGYCASVDDTTGDLR